MTRIRSSTRNTKSIDAFLRLMGLTNDGNQKGNKGQGAARRRLKFLASIFLLLACTLGVVHLCFPQRSEAASRGLMRHAKKVRRKISGKPVKFSHKEQVDLILEGKLNLVDLTIDKRALARAPKDSYEGIYGVFCKLNFAAHKKDPSSVPMFRDLVAHSPMCEGNYDEDDERDNKHEVPRGRIEINLKELAEAARQADAEGLYPNAKNLALTGVVFHESRCGSTLVANSLIAMNPEKHRVYSESAPPIAALNICAKDLDGDGVSPCSVGAGAKILRDVMYFMGRSDDANEERYFFKIQSAGTKAISIFRRSFPSTPWIFVYRDPVQVMMSHFAQGTHSANCLRGKNNPPLILQRLARRRGYSAIGSNSAGSDDENDGEGGSLEKMGPYEYCAAHLATLTETAAEHIHQSAGLGQAVNYEKLPSILYEKILPAWGVSVSETEIANIQKISGVYSKGRGNMKGEWHEDSEKKEAMASPEVQEASKLFLAESFDRLEKLASRF